MLHLPRKISKIIKRFPSGSTQTIFYLRNALRAHPQLQGMSWGRSRSTKQRCNCFQLYCFLINYLLFATRWKIKWDERKEEICHAVIVCLNVFERFFVVADFLLFCRRLFFHQFSPHGVCYLFSFSRRSFSGIK